MSERPTPETDAAWHSFTGNTEFAHNVKDLSRKLERERDEAREAIRALAEHGESEIQRITKERDEAREALASREVVIAQHSVITDLILERDKWAKLCGQYKQERDEAMSELKNNGQ